MPQTVLVTGATGYIAKHIVLKLLNAGFHVVGSTRSLDREAELRDAVTPHLNDAKDLAKRLRVVALDLTADDGWAQAMQGVDILMHTASPFPMSQPKNEADLIRPAVDGALRALKAAKAAGITRVALTSSVVAIAHGPLPERGHFDHTDWTDLTHPTATAYAKSKTLAEQAAWEYVKTDAPEIALTTINPGLVTGAPLDKHFGTSIKIVERLMKGTDPMLPNMGFAIVDVCDVADMHLAAIETPDSAGKRLVAVADSVWFKDMADVLAEAYPNRKIATRVAPDFVIRALALFDPAIRAILPELGRRPEISNAQTKDILGLEFLPAKASIQQTAAFLVDHKLVKT